MGPYVRLGLRDDPEVHHLQAGHRQVESQKHPPSYSGSLHIWAGQLAVSVRPGWPPLLPVPAEVPWVTIAAPDACPAMLLSLAPAVDLTAVAMAVCGMLLPAE